MPMPTTASTPLHRRQQPACAGKLARAALMLGAASRLRGMFQALQLAARPNQRMGLQGPSGVGEQTGKIEGISRRLQLSASHDYQEAAARAFVDCPLTMEREVALFVRRRIAGEIDDFLYPAYQTHHLVRPFFPQLP